MDWGLFTSIISWLFNGYNVVLFFNYIRYSLWKRLLTFCANADAYWCTPTYLLTFSRKIITRLFSRLIFPFPFWKQIINISISFQDNQNDLESATEMLSAYLERDITEENLVDLKQKLQDKYRYCDLRRQALMEHVYEGYDMNLWEYN